MQKPLAALTLALMLAGCGSAPTAPMAEWRNNDPWEAAAFKAKPAAEQVMLLEAALEDTHTQFKATADRASGKYKDKGFDRAAEGDFKAMADGMTRMADLDMRLAAAKYRLGDEESLAEAAAHEEAAAMAEEAAKRHRSFAAGAIGHMRETFWRVVNRLATGPTQAYFNRPGKKKLDPASDKLVRFGDREDQALRAVAQPGDVILWGSKSSFVHGSIYVGDGAIIHALANNTPVGPDAQGVFKERIADYMKRVERHRVVVLRPKKFGAADHQATVAYVVKQLGKPYDNVFRTKDQAAFYCTELAYHALKHGSAAPEVGTRKKLKGLMTVVTTDDFRLSSDLAVVYEKNAPPITPR